MSNRGYQFDLYNHLETSELARLYRIVVHSENEETAISKAREQANAIAEKWVREYHQMTGHPNMTPFKLYKIVGYVSKDKPSGH